jgi:hypothetical protein
MDAIETHAGGCHCGKVRYRVRLELNVTVYDGKSH